MKGSVLRAVELPDPTLSEAPLPPLRIDIGCGRTVMDGWVGIDALNFGQKWIADVSQAPWLIHGDADRHVSDKPGGYLQSPRLSHEDTKGRPKFLLKDNSVDEVRSSHFVEHLTNDQRIAFFNELYRVMKPKATALIVTPNWSHSCAYGDPTHQWPPMSQWYPLYLHAEWRAVNGPHVPYTCDFDHVIAGSWDQSIESRNPETKSFMMDKHTNAWRDLIVTLTSKKVLPS